MKKGCGAPSAICTGRHTGHINARNRWTGHLWQARFGSVAMDEEHLIADICHVSLNPVRARLVERAPRIGRGRACVRISGCSNLNPTERSSTAKQRGRRQIQLRAM
jgi:hypothetical protein